MNTDTKEKNINQHTVAKDIQTEFYVLYDLIITRQQAHEIRDARKNGCCVSDSLHYISTRSGDDIKRADAAGVMYSEYRVFYATEDWNRRVLACEFGPHQNIHAIAFA